jgi:hypothetical protein
VVAVTASPMIKKSPSPPHRREIPADHRRNNNALLLEERFLDASSPVGATCALRDVLSAKWRLADALQPVMFGLVYRSRFLSRGGWRLDMVGQRGRIDYISPRLPSHVPKIWILLVEIWMELVVVPLASVDRSEREVTRKLDFVGGGNSATGIGHNLSLFLFLFPCDSGVSCAVNWWVYSQRICSYAPHGSYRMCSGLGCTYTEAHCMCFSWPFLTVVNTADQTCIALHWLAWQVSAIFRNGRRGIEGK